MSSNALRTWVWLVFGVLASCTDAEVASIPAFPDGGLLRLGTALPQSSHVYLEGRFKVEQGTDLFGADLVITTGLNTVSLLSGKEAGVGALQAACLPGDRFVMEGHWRYPRGDEVGLVRLELDDAVSAAELCGGSDASRPLRFSGTWGHGTETPARTLELSYEAPLIPYRGRFFAIGHHGPCEATDACGVASNTREAVLLAERYGANAFEVDVRMTKDGVPLMFHDPSFNSSSSRGIFCQGALDARTYDEIQANCRATYGERIPTLQEFLDAVRENTLMEAVYLDMKVPDAVAPAAKAAAECNARAAADGRGLIVVVALTKDEVTEAWEQYVAKGVDVPPCLVEYDPDLVDELGCVAWAPQWTAGPRESEVAGVREVGARVVYWTLNDDNFIETYLRATNPDGAITGRPGLLMYTYQKIGQVPPPVDAVVP